MYTLPYTGGRVDLVWYGVVGNRTKPSITGLGLSAASARAAAKIQRLIADSATLQRHCRIRSYLTSARNHGHHP